MHTLSTSAHPAHLFHFPSCRNQCQEVWYLLHRWESLVARDLSGGIGRFLVGVCKKSLRASHIKLGHFEHFILPIAYGKARNDFWSTEGNYIYRHHVEPRVKFYVPKEESFSIQQRKIDVLRRTSTTLEVSLEKCIHYYWNVLMATETFLNLGLVSGHNIQ